MMIYQVGAFERSSEATRMRVQIAKSVSETASHCLCRERTVPAPSACCQAMEDLHWLNLGPAAALRIGPGARIGATRITRSGVRLEPVSQANACACACAPLRACVSPCVSAWLRCKAPLSGPLHARFCCREPEAILSL